MNTIDLDTTEKIHFVGIGGIGMSALARMMHASGKKVSGSDINDSELLEALRKERIEVIIGQDESTINNADLYIYSAALITFDPDFLEKVESRGKPMLTYPQALGLVSKTFKTIAVAGTHGKTTTTAMLGHVLRETGKKPHVIIGSVLKDGSNYIEGDTDVLVIEAGEYRRAFLNYYPDILAILNIEEDHLDYYKDLDDIVDAFKEFAGHVSEEGVIIGDLFDNAVHRAVEGAPAHKEQLKDPDPRISLSVPGEHTIVDAQFVIQIAKHLGVREEESLEHLRTYPGAWRRSEFIGEHKSGALIYDDYAHHPTEIKATLAGFRESFTEKRIHVVFEPHLYSRTKQLFEGFIQSFTHADEVIFAPIYAAREEHDPSITPETLANSVSELEPNKSVHAFDSFKKIEAYLNDTLLDGDLLLTMGAGDVYRIAQDLKV